MAVPGPSEIFRGRPALYHWFVDHPEQALETWRRLGANRTTDPNTDPYTSYDAAGNPTMYWSNGCHPLLFRPDFQPH